jgi:hypothetical protein
MDRVKTSVPRPSGGLDWLLCGAVGGAGAGAAKNSVVARRPSAAESIRVRKEPVVADVVFVVVTVVAFALLALTVWAVEKL